MSKEQMMKMADECFWGEFSVFILNWKYTYTMLRSHKNVEVMKQKLMYIHIYGKINFDI